MRFPVERAGSAAEQQRLVAEIRRISHPLRGARDLDPLIEQIGDARYVLLGEASHGTHEYYTWRAEISKRLIEEKGFSFIAVEGDWPDCYRVNCYVKGAPNSGRSAHAVLHEFDRWPTWMWANREVERLAEWLRVYNEDQPEERKVGFYGLDVYSLWDSMAAVEEYLRRVDPEAAMRIGEAYRCFEPYGEDVQQYAWASQFVPSSCEDEVVNAVSELRRNARLYAEVDHERYFNAEQNALVARNAELYYRTMVRGGAASWNIRDEHMVQTLERLVRFHGDDARAIVWEHNTHVGDARATDMAREGMVNVGQLVRERFGREGVALVGFGSHRGSVIAGGAWGAPMERMKVPEARPGSWEDLMHRAGAEDRLLLLSGAGLSPEWNEVRGHRAIGVVYNPMYEAFGNYVPTVLPGRYDAFLYIDRSHALRPIHMAAHEDGEVPETFPTGV